MLCSLLLRLIRLSYRPFATPKGRRRYHRLASVTIISAALLTASQVRADGLGYLLFLIAQERCVGGGFGTRIVSDVNGSRAVSGFYQCPGFNTYLRLIYNLRYNPKTKKVEELTNLQHPANSQAEGSGTNSNRGSTGSNPAQANAPQASPGQYVVGYQDSGFDTSYHAFITTSDGSNFIDLGTLDPSNSNAFSNATDVSDDGSHVVGFSDFNNGATQHAFRWTQAGGMIDLGSGNGASGFSRAFGVSGDGNTIVGDSDFPGAPRGPFLWTQGGSFQNLAPTGGHGVATAITDDASVVVGQSELGAFRWTAATHMVGLGTLSGDSDAAATGVSDNGKIVVGISAPRPLTRNNLDYDWGTDTHAFRWTQETGMKEFGALLSAAGVDMTGITIVALTGISTDGQFVTGQATTPDTEPNETVPFIAQYCDDNVGAACVTSFIVDTHDFDGDYKSDILWRQTTGKLVIWKMNGAQPPFFLNAGSATTDWQIAGTGDFDGDGEADILWRNNNGQVAVWLMNGGQRKSSKTIGTATGDWTVAGTGDFDGDGKSDILWHQTSTGKVSIWKMDGINAPTFLNPGSATTDWQIAGTGDFDGDGNADILWRNGNGKVAVWLMNGGQIKSTKTVGTATSDWTIAGTGDFDGDGKSDILWHQTSTGKLSIWKMDGINAPIFLNPGSATTDWQIAGTGDFDGDNNSDILWRNNNGNVAVWLMSGGKIKSTKTVGSATSDWSIQPQ
jgi:probable HAF family extracellular repeat protein